MRVLGWGGSCRGKERSIGGGGSGRAPLLTPQLLVTVYPGLGRWWWGRCEGPEAPAHPGPLLPPPPLLPSSLEWHPISWWPSPLAPLLTCHHPAHLEDSGPHLASTPSLILTCNYDVWNSSLPSQPEAPGEPPATPHSPPTHPHIEPSQFGRSEPFPERIGLNSAPCRSPWELRFCLHTILEPGSWPYMALGPGPAREKLGGAVVSTTSQA